MARAHVRRGRRSSGRASRRGPRRGGRLRVRARRRPRAALGRVRLRRPDRPGGRAGAPRRRRPADAGRARRPRRCPGGAGRPARRPRGRRCASQPLPLLDPAPVGRFRVDSVAPPEHYEGAVARAVERIRAGAFEKIVLAREVTVQAPSAHDAAAVFGVLRAGFESCYVFCAGRGDAAFVAASPELLIRRDGHRAQTVALAGSTRRSADPAVDDHLGEQLLHSDKDREEQAIVVRRIARALRPHAVWVAAPDEPTLIKVANIQHLATPIRAQLTNPLERGRAGRPAAPDARRRRRAARGGRASDPRAGGPGPRLVRGRRRLDRRQRRRRVLRRPALRPPARRRGAPVRRRRRRPRLRPRRGAQRDRDQARRVAPDPRRLKPEPLFPALSGAAEARLRLAEGPGLGGEVGGLYGVDRERDAEVRDAGDFGGVDEAAALVGGEHDAVEDVLARVVERAMDRAELDAVGRERPGRRGAAPGS